MTAVRSVRKEADGFNAADKVVLRVLAASTPSADPGAEDFGDSLQGGDFLHLYCDLDTSTDLTVTPWYLNDITGIWHEDAANQVVFSAAQTRFVIETRGEQKVFLVADAQTGAPVTAVLVWAAYSYSDADVR